MKKTTFRILGLVLSFVLIFNLFVFAEDAGEVFVVNDLGDVKIVAEKYYNYYRGNKFPMYKNYGVTDKDGNVIVEQKYLGILPPVEGRAAFAIDWKIGFFDENWNICIEPKYHLNQLPFSGIYFSEGRAAIPKKDDLRAMVWGYIDRDGNEVIDFIYDNASHFKNGVAEVELREQVYHNTMRKYAQIDRDGGIVKPFKFAYSLERDYEIFWKEPIEVQLSQNLVELNGRRYKNSDIEYPFINYLGFSYIPLTYHGCRMLGINCDWTEETGVVLSGGGEMAEDIVGSNGMMENMFEKATFYKGKLTINGTTYEYGDTAYPLIHYKNVVYMPVLWQTGMEALGIEYSFIGKEHIENSDRGCMVFKTNQSPIENNKKENLDSFRTVGYYSYDLFDEPLEKLQTDKLTHIMYAFLIPQKDGSVLPLAEEENARQLIKKAHNDNCKVYIAVGGWSYKDVPLQSAFEEAAKTPETRKKLVESIVRVVEDYGFDGVELDWEYPNSASSSNYEALILELSAELEKLDKHLTAALNGAWSQTEGPEVSKYVSDACLDAFEFISVMSYDMNNEQHSPFWFANTSIDYWLHRGVSADKIVLGMPLYARPTFMQYRHLVEKDKDFAYTDFAEVDGKASHYNGLPTLCKKTILAAKKAGGVMLFDVNEDTNDETSVVSMIDETLSHIENNGFEDIASLEFLKKADNTDELIGIIK